MVIVMEGFHGTSNDCSDQILAFGLTPSIGYKQWLGDGGYLFVEGIGKSPNIQAKNWAIAQAWDNELKKNKYSYYAVISGTIEVEEEFLLDLTTNDGIAILDYIESQCKKKLQTLRLEYIDGYLINFARGENIVPIKVSKGDFFIKFKDERIFNLRRKTHNCTICAVYDSQNDIKNMRKLEKGRIEQ